MDWNKRWVCTTCGLELTEEYMKDMEERRWRGKTTLDLFPTEDGRWFHRICFAEAAADGQNLLDIGLMVRQQKEEPSEEQEENGNTDTEEEETD